MPPAFSPGRDVQVVVIAGGYVSTCWCWRRASTRLGTRSTVISCITFPDLRIGKSGDYLYPVLSDTMLVVASLCWYATPAEGKRIPLPQAISVSPVSENNVPDPPPYRRRRGLHLPEQFTFSVKGFRSLSGFLFLSLRLRCSASAGLTLPLRLKGLLWPASDDESQERKRKTAMVS